MNLYEDLDATNNLYVYVRVAGTFAEVMKVDVGEIDMDTWYLLNTEVEGNVIRAYLDGDLKIEAEHDARPEGGIAFQRETNTQAHFDDLQVEGEGIAPSEVSSGGKLANVWAQTKRF